MKKIIAALGTVLLLCSLISAYDFFDNKWASAEDFQLLSMRLENKIVGDKIYDKQKLINLIKEPYMKDPASIPLKDQKVIRQLEKDIKDLEEGLKVKQKG